jgi:phosphoglycolate phosphatase-like HAD superfamily hydrolase
MGVTFSYNSSMKIRNVIFDIDGTIADVEHRRHFVEQKPADWKSFRAETVNDTPMQWVVDVAKRFIAQGDHVAFFSARNESEREITEKQISEWVGDGHKGLFLRPDGDYRPDEEFKSDLADTFEEMGGTIDLVFDDRNKVVDMWRKRGTTVVQVAEGDF